MTLRLLRISAAFVFATALLAAEQLGRVCYALECSPAFCDVIVERWQRLTGKEAVRHG